jgi:rRNA-processing protein FCF1
MGQYDVQALSEALMGFLQDLPSPIIPECVYPSLKIALQEEAGNVIFSTNMLLHVSH